MIGGAAMFQSYRVGEPNTYIDTIYTDKFTYFDTREEAVEYAKDAEFDAVEVYVDHDREDLTPGHWQKEEV
jgi:L-ribulose-5-phosphate 3-epimerase UlaE